MSKIRQPLPRLRHYQQEKGEQKKISHLNARPWKDRMHEMADATLIIRRYYFFLGTLRITTVTDCTELGPTSTFKLSKPLLGPS